MKLIMLGRLRHRLIFLFRFLFWSLPIFVAWTLPVFILWRGPRGAASLALRGLRRSFLAVWHWSMPTPRVPSGGHVGRGLKLPIRSYE